MATRKNTTKTKDPQKSGSEPGKIVEYEYKKITRKRRFSPEIAHKTIELIMDHFGISELEDNQVMLVSKMIETGRLGFSGGVATYQMSKGIEIHGGKIEKSFTICEPTDAQFKTAEIDLLAVMQNEDEDLSSSDTRGIAALTIGLALEFKERIRLKDVNALNAIYTLFYLSQ